MYRYDIGLKVGSYTLPDPSKLNMTLADLDTEAERDASGTLNRTMVAQKLTVELSWDVLTWELCSAILQAVDSDSFPLPVRTLRPLRVTIPARFM